MTTNETFRKILMHAAILAAFPVLADRTPPEGTATLYGDWSVKQNIDTGALAWTNNADSTRIAWTQDSYGIVETPWSSGNFTINGFHFWGLKWNVSSKKWATISNNVHIEAGGLEMPIAGSALMIGADDDSSRLYLVATSQTWSGPENGRAHFGFGHDNYQGYYKMRVNAKWCPEWILEKGMNVWITWTNRFYNTDVKVNYPARIWLEKRWVTSSVTYEGRPMLGAKTLTLSGDGTMWEAGGTASIGNTYKTPELEPEMNADTVTSSLTLKDGADLLGRSAGWDIPALTVTGTGESAFNGGWTFRRSVTDVSIAVGSVLALTGDIADGENPAGLNVTGSGTLKLDPSTFALTGSLTLGSDVTLLLVGHGGFSHRIDGGKEIRIESDGDKRSNALHLCASALAGFTGSRVVITSGAAIVDDKAGVTVEEDGGRRIVPRGFVLTYR